MTRLFNIAVELEEDYVLVEVFVDATYCKDEYDQCSESGRWHKTETAGWELEGYTWDQTKYSKEQNDAILEACFREESNFLDAFNEEE